MTNELYLSQIEIGTPVCRTLADVRAELVRLRRAVVEAAGRDGSRIAAAGTHPFSHWEDQALTPKPRYETILHDFQQLTREQIIFGCHVHVGIADREAAIQVMNRARPWLRADPGAVGEFAVLAGRRHRLCQLPDRAVRPVPDGRDPDRSASRAEYDEVVAALVGPG